MSRGQGCARRPGEAGASGCPRSRALLPLFPLQAEALQTPLAWLPQRPHSPVCLPSKGRRRGPTGARVLEPAFPGLCLCGFGGSSPWCTRGGRRCARLAALQRERESEPPSFLFRPSCDSAGGRGWPTARPSGPEWWRRTEMGASSPARLLPRMQWERADRPLSFKGLDPEPGGTGNMRDRGRELTFPKRLIHSDHSFFF